MLVSFRVGSRGVFSLFVVVGVVSFVSFVFVFSASLTLFYNLSEDVHGFLTCWTIRFTLSLFLFKFCDGFDK